MPDLDQALATIAGDAASILVDLNADLERTRRQRDAALDALADIAGIVLDTDGNALTVAAECLDQFDLCTDRYPTDPNEWCSVCVAEVAWYAITTAASS